MNFKLSRAAEIDLEEIWMYTFENWSNEQADRYINLIFEEIDYICRNPNSGAELSFLKEGYYKSRIKSHFIFYKINRKEGDIEIIRILHQRMDIENRLS